MQLVKIEEQVLLFIYSPLICLSWVLLSVNRLNLGCPSRSCSLFIFRMQFYQALRALLLCVAMFIVTGLCSLIHTTITIDSFIT